MMSVRALSWTNMVRLTQADKIILTLVLACLLPMALHALPLSSTAAGLGQTWLPMFYAPLIASLCFRPHVSLAAGLCAPWINHLLFGMPADKLVLPMTFHLVVFIAIVLWTRRRSQPAGWAVAAAYTLALFLTRFIFTREALGQVVDLSLRSLATALPGILVSVILTEVVRHFYKRQDV